MDCRSRRVKDPHPKKRYFRVGGDAFSVAADLPTSESVSCRSTSTRFSLWVLWLRVCRASAAALVWPILRGQTATRAWGGEGGLCSTGQGPSGSGSREGRCGPGGVAAMAVVSAGVPQVVSGVGGTGRRRPGRCRHHEPAPPASLLCLAAAQHQHGPGALAARGPLAAEGCLPAGGGPQTPRAANGTPVTLLCNQPDTPT